MVRKIVYDQNASLFAFYIHTAFDAAERREGFRQNVGGDAAPMGYGDGGQRVQYVVSAFGCRSKFAKRCTVVGDAETRSVAVDRDFSRDPVVVRAKAVGLDWTE